MNKYINIIGLILVMIGTIFSLWSVLGTKSANIQTAKFQDNQQEYFKKDKKKVIIGIMLIILGTILQIAGTLM